MQNKLVTILITVIVTVAIGGAGVYVWQNSQPIPGSLELKNPQDIPPSTDTSKAEIATLVDPVCTDPPVTLEIGRDVYPVAEKYKHLEFLGQLFTAYPCGQERMAKIFGVEGDSYTLGSSIKLKGQPSQALIDTYLSIGFSCYEVSTGGPCKSETGAKKIELKDSVKIDALMKLEPF